MAQGRGDMHSRWSGVPQERPQLPESDFVVDPQGRKSLGGQNAVVRGKDIEASHKDSGKPHKGKQGFQQQGHGHSYLKTRYRRLQTKIERCVHACVHACPCVTDLGRLGS